MKGIGLERDGELVAGVLYDNINRHNAWAHIATHLPGLWVPLWFLRLCYAYPFEQCGVRRLSGYVRESNTPCVRLLERMGWQREAALKGAATDGGDVLIFVLWREQCRFLGGRDGWSRYTPA